MNHPTTWTNASGRGVTTTAMLEHLAAAAAASHDAAEAFRAVALANQARTFARCGMTPTQVREHNAATLAAWAQED